MLFRMHSFAYAASSHMHAVAIVPVGSLVWSPLIAMHSLVLCMEHKSFASHHERLSTILPSESKIHAQLEGPTSSVVKQIPFSLVCSPHTNSDSQAPLLPGVGLMLAVETFCGGHGPEERDEMNACTELVSVPNPACDAQGVSPEGSAG
jgi:hypothetical protein